MAAAGAHSQKLELLLGGLLEQIREQHSGQVPLPERRDDHHDVLAAVLRSAAEEQRSLHCGPRGNPTQDALQTDRAASVDQHVMSCRGQLQVHACSTIGTTSLVASSLATLMASAEDIWITSSSSAIVCNR